MPVCTRTVCSHAAGSLPAQAGNGRRSKESGGRQHARGGLPEQSARRLCADRVRDSRRERESESRVKREARMRRRNAWHTLTSMSFAPPWYTIHRKTSEVSVVFVVIPKHSTCAGGTITRSAHACAAHTTSAVMTAYTVLRGAIVLAGAEFAVRMRCGRASEKPFCVCCVPKTYPTTHGTCTARSHIAPTTPFMLTPRAFSECPQPVLEMTIRSQASAHCPSGLHHAHHTSCLSPPSPHHSLHSVG